MSDKKSAVHFERLVALFAPTEHSLEGSMMTKSRWEIFVAVVVVVVAGGSRVPTPADAARTPAGDESELVPTTENQLHHHHYAAVAGAPMPLGA